MIENEGTEGKPVYFMVESPKPLFPVQLSGFWQPGL
jgi:hypothetical protein